MTAHLFTTWFTEYFTFTVETNRSEKRFLSKCYCLLTMHLVTQDVQRDSCCFMPANTKSILQPMDQGVILAFKSYHLRNTFCKAIAAVDSDSSDGSVQS